MELVNNKTRLVFIDHITSETATILPVEKISRELKAYGIPIFIDGAHAPGMIPLDLNIIAPDYYTGNCHKWLSSPKGAAFLYVDPARQENMIPSIISNFFRKGDNVREKFYNSFFWSGTAIDYLSCCAVKPAIKHLAESVEGGWPEIMKRNHELVIKGRDILREMLDLEIFTPEEMTGSMVTFLLNSRGEKDPLIGIDKLLLSLFEKYKIESFITNLYNTDRRILRISAHLYNREEDYARLGTALKEIL
jgi:isopenicillin-N epimerase